MHMSFQKEWFVSLEEHTTIITLADDSKLKCGGKGDVRFSCNGKSKLLRDVLYVPELSANLISVPQLVDRGFEVVFGKDECSIKNKSGNVLLCGMRRESKVRGGLFVVDCDSVQWAHIASVDNMPVESGEPIQDTSDLWHRMLGHLHDQGISLAIGQVSGMGKVSGKERPCEICLEGKMVKKSFPKQCKHRATRRLEIIHTDIMGPSPVVSFKGDSKAYRLADPSKPGTVFIRYHVSFLEGVRDPTNRKPVPELFNVPDEQDNSNLDVTVEIPEVRIEQPDQDEQLSIPPDHVG
ncbi:Retrovirus-related Pol polyprotein from transposon TNT 1-94 [Frankliniella fusca]|uniref:Retrovirus-related Pol polyprotein from transposon TNT 1-94 n=1 Tax=Frankliniella fusca TaxID=407009 RepID=A0AAE1HZK0_9NEOP|nr:Retrovirus-related Pol polyprotein from transposon TNT 1-94 [Frankliniella fusca]KAK3929565.1 Retrovirus-related Pol polyprotein from transposon TNT 1-94 [Frankliniella fusca]